MCFLVSSDYPDAMIAEEDIKCYKVVKLTKGNTLESMYQFFNYEKEKTYEGDVYIDEVYNPFEPSEKDKVINMGFHSYITEDKAKEMQKSLTELRIAFSPLVVLECVIPKGSTYFRSDKDSEFVSSALRVDAVGEPYSPKPMWENWF